MRDAKLEHYIYRRELSSKTLALESLLGDGGGTYNISTTDCILKILYSEVVSVVKERTESGEAMITEELSRKREIGARTYERRAHLHAVEYTPIPTTTIYFDVALTAGIPSDRPSGLSPLIPGPVAAVRMSRRPCTGAGPTT